MAGSSSACYDRDCLAAWALGRLSSQRFEEVSAHLERCGTCQQAVAAFEQLSDPLLHLLREPAPVVGVTAEKGLETAARSQALPTTPFVPGGAAPPPFLRELPGIEVGELLGKGGMGQVYKARHVRLNRLVAVKVMSQPAAPGEDGHKRFEREMQALAKLDHPNIVRIHHADEAHARPYLVMDFVEGVSLSEHVRQRGPLPVAEACEVVRQAALGLQHAHERGVIHRDVKPGNLMLTRDGVVKILDMGLARLSMAGGGEESLTGPGAVMGTLGYAAPEQLRNPRSAGAPADVFSLGCTLYFLLTGECPFPGSTVTEKLDALARMSPKPLAAARPDCPEEVATMVATMMNERPTARIASAGLVAERLRSFCREGGGTLTGPSASSRRRLLWAAVAGVAALVGLVVWLMAGQTVRVKTPQGTLVLRFPKGMPATAEVLVDGSRVTLKGIDKERGEVVVDVGTRKLEVRDGDKTFRDDKVRIERDNATVVEVMLERAPAAALQPREKAADDGPEGEIISMAGGRDVALVRFAPGGRIALTLFRGGPLGIWDLEKRQVVHSWDTGERVHSPPAVFTLDGRSVVSAPKLILFDPIAGKIIGKLVGDWIEAGLHDMSFSANGKRFLVAKHDGFIHLWNLPAGKQHRKFKHAVGPVTACWTPDGKFILSGGSDGVMRLWDVENDRQEKTYEGHGEPVVFVRLFAGGKRFVSASPDGKVIVWDLESGKQLHKLTLENVGAYFYTISSLAVAPESSRLVAGHLNGSISVWDLDKGERMRQFAGHKKGSVYSLDVTPDGRYALSFSAGEQLLRYWRLPPVRGQKGLPDPIRQADK